MERFAKIFNGRKPLIIFENATFYMFDSVSNIPACITDENIRFKTKNIQFCQFCLRLGIFGKNMKNKQLISYGHKTTNHISKIITINYPEPL